MSRFKLRRFEIFVLVGLVFGIWFAFLFSYARTRNIEREQSCQSNLKNLALGTMQYVRDYDEQYPLANRWHADLDPFVRKEAIFHCPSQVKYGYAFNKHLSGRTEEEINLSLGWEKVPLFFDSSLLKESASGNAAIWPEESRHPQGNGVIFNDGHFEWRQKPPIFQAVPLLKQKPRKEPRKKSGRRP